MIDAEVASGLDAAFKTIDAVDGPSFIKNLLGDYRVGTKLDWKGAVIFFTKAQALSYQKYRKNKCKYACGLMTETDTHTHASNDSYEHPPR